MTDIWPVSVGAFHPQSPQAAAIAHLFTVALWICAAIFLLVTGLVGYSVVRYRALDGAADPAQVEGHRGLEIGWTLGPVAIVLFLLALTTRAMSASDPPAAGALDVVVTAHQWWWEVKYSSGAITANEIHIPTGRPLAFRLESADVIHDFWVPELGRKMDATPGHPTTIWLEADTPGVYLGACAEFCGAEHAWMRIRVVAQSPAEFEVWERRQLEAAPAPAGDGAEHGAALFDRMTCAGCHRIQGTAAGARFGPDLTHLAGRATLGAGVVANTPAELVRWLRDPQAIKPGCHMPNAELSADDASALVAYLDELR